MRGKRFHCLRAISARIVQQNDIAIVPLLFHPLHDDVRSGLGPILRIDAFQNHEIIEILRNFQRGQIGQLRRTRYQQRKAGETMSWRDLLSFRAKAVSHSVPAGCARASRAPGWDDNKCGFQFRVLR